MANEEHIRIGWNFKRLREQRGWSQEEAAAKIEALPNYIAQIESSKCSFGINARKKWAAIFEVDIHEFYKPITQTEKDKVIGQIEFELSKLDIEKIQRIKDLIPVLFGGENVEKRRENIPIPITKKTA